jgi:hypothetical protein
MLAVMSETPQPNYNDSYPTCVKTYSTLRIFSDELGPEQITQLLQAEATDAFRKGDVYGSNKLQRKTNGWFYCTEALTSSKDGRRHIDLILAALEGKSGHVQELHSRGCKIDITSYWSSAGQGGPWLMAEQMLKLGALGISIWWDIYFSDEDAT